MVREIAEKCGLENLFKKALIEMSNGLLEYLRLCVEELVEIGRSNRFYSYLNNIKMAPGQVSHYRCFDQYSYHGMCPPLEVETLCFNNPHL